MADGRLETEAGVVGAGLGLVLGAWLWTIAHYGVNSTGFQQQAGRAYVTSLLATEHLVIKKNPLKLVF